MPQETEFDPKLDKVVKKLGVGVKEEMDAMKESDLRNVIVESTNNIAVATAELENNTKYQNLKSQFKAAGEGLRDTKKAQKAKIDYALHCLEGMGKI